MYACVYICLCIYACICMLVYICVCLYVCLCICVCIYTYINLLKGLQMNHTWDAENRILSPWGRVPQQNSCLSQWGWWRATASSHLVHKAPAWCWNPARFLEQLVPVPQCRCASLVLLPAKQSAGSTAGWINPSSPNQQKVSLKCPFLIRAGPWRCHPPSGWPFLHH